MRPRGLVLASPKVNVWPLLFAHIVTVLVDADIAAHRVAELILHGIRDEIVDEPGPSRLASVTAKLPGWRTVNRCVTVQCPSVSCTVTSWGGSRGE
jgi:hypothetical protein